MDVSEQKPIALYTIQQHLMQKRADHAIALLRAAREVWPEGDVFGEEDAEPEDEFIILREILHAEMDRPQGYRAAEVENMVRTRLKYDFQHRL